jgi:hypothetical protein
MERPALRRDIMARIFAQFDNTGAGGQAKSA